MAKTHSTLKLFLQKRNMLFMFIVCVGFSIIGGVLYSASVYARCPRISCIQLPKSAVLKLTEVYEEVRGSVYRARYQMGDVIVRVDVRSDVDPDASTDYIKGRIAGMKALYDNIRSPYPGLLSNEIVCDEGFKPTYELSENSKYLPEQKIIGYLNDRLTFGSCQKDQAVYKGMMVLFTCSSTRQLYQIEFITKTEQFNAKIFETILDGLSCR